MQTFLHLIHFIVVWNKYQDTYFAPASEGAQYETKWFYERARGQYLQEQMRLTPAKKKQIRVATS